LNGTNTTLIPKTQPISYKFVTLHQSAHVMRYLINILFFQTLISCHKDTEQPPYFSFDLVGKEILSGLKLNDTIHYQGSNGTILSFRIFKIDHLKESVRDCNWNTGYCKTFYSYDVSSIYLVRTDTIPPFPNSPLTTTFTKQMVLPKEIDRRNIPPNNTVAHATLRGGGGIADFNAKPSITDEWTSPYIPYPNYYEPIQFVTFTNAVRTFNKVSIIHSGNNAVFIDPIYSYRYTVNEVWFDKEFGIVFFKDVFGNSWSRIN